MTTEELVTATTNNLCIV